jgi:hypothetical protein
VLKAIAKSIILMKKIDINFYGNDIKKSWLKIRKKRYNLEVIPSVAYTLLPYLK